MTIAAHRYTRRLFNRSYDYVGGVVPGKFGWCFGTDLDNPLQVSSSIDTVTTESGSGEEQDIAKTFGVMPEPMDNAALATYKLEPSYTFAYGTGAWLDVREAHLSARGTSSAATVNLIRPRDSAEASADANFVLDKDAMPTIWVDCAEDPGDGEMALLWPVSGNLHHGFWFMPRAGLVMAVSYDSGSKAMQVLQRWKRPILPLGSFTTLRILQVGAEPVLMGNGQFVTFPQPSTITQKLVCHYYCGRSGAPGNFWIGVAPTLWPRQKMTLRYNATNPADNSWVDATTIRHRLLHSVHGLTVSPAYDTAVPDTLIVTIDSTSATEYDPDSGFTAAYAVLFRHEAYTTATLYANTDTLAEMDVESLQLVLDTRPRGQLDRVSTPLAYPVIEVEDIWHSSDDDTTGTIMKQSIWFYTNMLVNHDDGGTPSLNTTVIVRGVDELLRTFSCDFIPHPVEWVLQTYIRYVLQAVGIRSDDFFYDYAGEEITVAYDAVNYDRYHPSKFPDPFALIEKIAADHGLLFFWSGSVFCLIGRDHNTMWTATYSSTFLSPVLTIGNDKYEYTNLAKVYDAESHETRWFGATQLLDAAGADFYPFPVTRQLAIEDAASIGRQPLSVRAIMLIGNYSVGQLVKLVGYPAMGGFDLNKTYRIKSIRIEGLPGYCTLDLQEYLSETL